VTFSMGKNEKRRRFQLPLGESRTALDSNFPYDIYKYDRNFRIVYIPFEEMDAEDSDSSLSEVSSLGADFDTLHLESDSSDEEVPDDGLDSHTWDEIEPESDAEFLEDHGLIEDVTSISKGDTINPIDCYLHFITDVSTDLMVRETNLYSQQYMQSHRISRRSMFHQWKSTANEELLKFVGIVIEMGLVQMSKLKYYRSSSQLYGSQIIRNVMSRERFELLLRFWQFSNYDKGGGVGGSGCECMLREEIPTSIHRNPFSCVCCLLVCLFFMLYRMPAQILQ
jgi:hypothetical protein